MINAWLDLPIAPLFAVLALVYALSVAVIHWLTFYWSGHARVQSLTGVVAPYFTSVALLFGLLTGFLANDIAERGKSATRAVLAESDSLQTLNALSVAAAVDMSIIREAIRAYAQAAIGDEWAQMAEGASSPKAEAALATLMQAVASPAITREAGQAIHNRLLEGAVRTRTARSDRLSLATDRTHEIKWATVLMLCLITQIAIAVVHLERPRAQLAALTIFSVAAVIALGLIALQEQPFDGAVRVTPAPLEKVLAAMPAPA